MPISGNPTIFGVDPYHAGNNTDTTVGGGNILGTLAVDPDGRAYRYGQLASTAVAQARLCVKAALSTNHEDVAFQTAGVVGDSQALITIATTSVAANEYDDGFLVIIDDTGEGYVHRITRHGTGTGTITFGIAPNLQEATTTSTTVTLVRNEWRDLLIATGGTQTDIPAGVTVSSMAADEFGWFAVQGVHPVLSSGTNVATAGQPITIGEATNGTVSERDAVAEPLVGYAPTGVGPTAGEENPYYVSIV